MYRLRWAARHVARVLVTVLAFSSLANATEPVATGYRLQPGDVLQVVVWKETDLQSEVLIRPDGGISFALAGDMQAAGRTTAELRTELETRVRKLIPDAVVTVSVKAPNGNQIFVIGKVNQAGRLSTAAAHRCDAGPELGRRRNAVRKHKQDSSTAPGRIAPNID